MTFVIANQTMMMLKVQFESRKVLKIKKLRDTLLIYIFTKCLRSFQFTSLR